LTQLCCNDASIVTEVKWVQLCTAGIAEEQ